MVEFNRNPNSTKVEFPFELNGGFPNYNVLFGEITHSDKVESNSRIWLDKIEATYFTAYSSAAYTNETVLVSVFGFLP